MSFMKADILVRISSRTKKQISSLIARTHYRKKTIIRLSKSDPDMLLTVGIRRFHEFREGFGLALDDHHASCVGLDEVSPSRTDRLSQTVPHAHVHLLDKHQW